jgi:hypothetical protein
MAVNSLGTPVFPILVPGANRIGGHLVNVSFGENDNTGNVLLILFMSKMITILIGCIQIIDCKI